MLVPLRSTKVTGVVVAEGVTPPAGLAIADVGDVLDTGAPALTRELVELCAWISEYYEAPIGEVVKAALPGGTAVAARVVVALTEAGRAAVNGSGAALPAKQRTVLAKLAGRPLPPGELGGRDQVTALVEAGLVEWREQRAGARARAPRERVVELAPGVDQAALTVSLARSPTRRAVVAALAAHGAMATRALAREVPGAAGAVRELVKVGVVTVSGASECRTPRWPGPVTNFATVFASMPIADPRASRWRSTADQGDALTGDGASDDSPRRRRGRRFVCRSSFTASPGAARPRSTCASSRKRSRSAARRSCSSPRSP